MNDTIENVDGFVDLCEEVNATFAIIALDYYSTDKISSQMREMILRMKNAISSRNILCVPYTGGETVEYKDTINKLMEE